MYINNHKRVQKILDAYHTRSALVEFRKKALDHQNKLNYQLEYDRIRGELARSRIPATTVAKLRKRKNELIALGAKAVNKIGD